MELANVKTDFFKPGAIVYFKHCARAPSTKSDGVASPDGFMFGILLGALPKNSPSVSAKEVFTVSSTFGMVTIDSIFELMGDEVGHTYIQKLVAKIDAEQKAASLVAPDGQPLARGPRLVLPPGTET
jgi:hypothetical protein